MGTLGSPPSGSVVQCSQCAGNVCEASLYEGAAAHIGESYTVKGEGVLCYIPCTFLVHISDSIFCIIGYIYSPLPGLIFSTIHLILIRNDDAMINLFFT